MFTLLSQSTAALCLSLSRYDRMERIVEREEVRKEYKDGLESPPLAITRNGKVEKEKNPKWLLDDYVKFIRFAQQKIDNQKADGIFGFISNNSFLDNTTFRGMRYSLLKSFDEIYIVNLHGNTRKKEVCPDGSKDENVFDIMQGVSINIFVKHTQKIKDKRVEYSKLNPSYYKHGSDYANVYYYDLYGKREYKYNFLLDNNIKTIEWKKLEYKEPFFLFIPQNDDLREEYDKFYSIKDMFRLYNVGIVTSKDSVLIGLNKDKLEEQVKNYYNEFDISFIEIINYRPFDKRFVYYDTDKIERARKDIMEHFLKDENNVGLISNRSVALNIYQHTFITDMITDLHIIETANASAYIFPLYIYKTDNVVKFIIKESKDWVDDWLKFTDDEEINPFEKSNKIENFTLNFRNFIDKKYGSHFPPEEVLGYIYAILFHKTYRTKYIDFLKFLLLILRIYL